MKGSFGMGSKVNGGKTSGLRTAPEGHHKTRRDRQLEAIFRAEEQLDIWKVGDMATTAFGKGMVAKIEERLKKMQFAMTGIAGGSS